MDHGLARLLSPATNYAVVQLPGRRFPGVVFQGDSLFILVRLARKARELADRADDADLVDACADVCESLEGVLAGYEAVLREQGIALPY